MHLGPPPRLRDVDDPILRDAGRKANETDGHGPFAFSQVGARPARSTLTRRAPLPWPLVALLAPFPAAARDDRTRRRRRWW